jgi:YHS domain-containing protein
MNVTKFIISVLLIYLLYKIIKIVRQLKPEENKINQSKSSPAEGEDLIEDPVCHTYVPVSQAYKREISGRDYYFCSKQCSDKYTLEKNN